MLDRTWMFLESARQMKAWEDDPNFQRARAEVESLRTLPEIVCLCGSGRFKEAILAASERLTMQGHIVLAPNVFAAEIGQFDKPGRIVNQNEKDLLDVLHFRKIDLSKRVHVVNCEGYIGESVHKEVTYAVRTGKLVTFDCDVVIPWDTRAKVPVSVRHYIMAIQERIAMEQGV